MTLARRRSPGQRPTTARVGAPLDEAGLSLAAILVAMVVFTVGALGLAAVIPVGMNKVTDSASSSHASILASERCEELLARPYDDEDLDAGAHEDALNPYDGLYEVKWNVEVNQPLTECKRVTVNVYRTSSTASIARLVIVVPHTGS